MPSTLVLLPGAYPGAPVERLDPQPPTFGYPELPSPYQAEPYIASYPNEFAQNDDEMAPATPPGPVDSPLHPQDRSELRALRLHNQNIMHLHHWFPRNIPENSYHALTNILATELSKQKATNVKFGYIYVIWETPLTEDAPDELAKYFATNGRHAGGLANSLSNQMLQYTVASASDANVNHPPTLKGPYANEGKMLLKIGYTKKNPLLRIRQWSRKCRRAVSPLLIYDLESGYINADISQPRRRDRPSSRRRSDPSDIASTSLPDSSIMDDLVPLPYITTIEALIHASLKDKQIAKCCDVCKSLHKEWFEMDATVESIQTIDSYIQNWLQWAKNCYGQG